MIATPGIQSALAGNETLGALVSIIGLSVRHDSRRRRRRSGWRPHGKRPKLRFLIFIYRSWGPLSRPSSIVPLRHADRRVRCKAEQEAQLELALESSAPSGSSSASSASSGSSWGFWGSPPPLRFPLLLQLRGQ